MSLTGIVDGLPRRKKRLERHGQTRGYVQSPTYKVWRCSRLPDRTCVSR